MHNIIHHPASKLNTDYRLLGQRLIIHYIADGKVLCEAECRLTANTRFLEIPLPVIHQMMRGTMK